MVEDECPSDLRGEDPRAASMICVNVVIADPARLEPSLRALLSGRDGCGSRPSMGDVSGVEFFERFSSLSTSSCLALAAIANALGPGITRCGGRRGI